VSDHVLIHWIGAVEGHC